MRKKRTVVLAVLACIAAVAGVWWYFASREIAVWVYTDYAFRYNHPEWPGLVEARFREVNRIYQRSGTGIRWKVLDSNQIDPTRDVAGLDRRRAAMALHFDHPADVFVVLTGVRQGDRTGSASPFTRVAVVVDYPDKSESQNSRLLASELSHLFGTPRDPAWFASLTAENSENARFSDRDIALIERMRGYPFKQGIEALKGSWDKRALAAVSQDVDAKHGNAMAYAHTVLGVSLLNERKMAPALAHFRAAVAADPQNKTMHLNLAEAYARDGQFDLSLAEARETVRVAPGDALAHRALGALLGRNRQPEAALQELQTAIRLDPKNAENEVLLGIQYTGMFGHLDDAVSTLQEATRADPESPLAHVSLERAQALKQRVEDVIAIERGRVHDNPNDAEAHYRLAKAEERAGDFQGAIRDFQKVAELQPASGSPHAELAELYLVKGDTATAWAEIRKARALGTEPPATLISRLPPQK
jgi:tetratricopeptide (TPR) repeat protein